jgi:FAD:protein FMN transferase
MKPVCTSIRRARPLLGTFVEIAVSGTGRTTMEEAVEAAFATVAEVHRLMSFQDPASDVARLNRKAAERAIIVHPWTFEVLEAALQIQRCSAGIFDIAAAQTRRSTSRVGSVELYPGRRVRFSDPGVAIDLAGIAKGFAVDRAIDVLRGRGVPQGLVNAGGDLASWGPEEAPIWLRDPRDPGRILCRTEIRGEALASSGPKVDPFRGSDTTETAVIDPRTLRHAQAALGATVRVDRCMIADALTKVVMVAGEAASPILAQYGASALFLSPDGDLRVSGNWQSAVRLAA